MPTKTYYQIFGSWKNWNDASQYCQSMHSNLASFHDIETYNLLELLHDDMGEITGCLWMTSTMRMNFELYGGYLSVDAMKRDINTLLWPYMATSLWNDLNEVCVGCEGILLSEREEAYKAMLDFQVRKRFDIGERSALTLHLDTR